MQPFRSWSSLLVAFAITIAAAGQALADARFLTLASTTSTQNSGLFDAILPAFTRETGIEVRVVAVGTGQAIRLGERGDADVLLVHHRPSEERFVAEGFGVARHDVMYNDFVILGPAADPAGIAGETDAAAAFRAIAEAEAPFASRADESGTHLAERALWKAAGIDPSAASGSWYRETGSGMGATLNVASGMNAYVLSDRATWLAFRNPGELRILVEGDPALFNQYGVIRVDPARHAHVKIAEAKAFVDWLLSPAGQRAIAAYQIGGKPVFFPNAK